MKKILFTVALFLVVGVGVAKAYTVQPGDSLSKIGQKFGVSWQELWDLNPHISDPNFMYAGEEISTGIEMLGATLPIAGATYNLAGSGVTGSATSITLQSLTVPQTGRKLVDSEFSSTFYITLEPGNTRRQEIASCTTVTQNANDTATLSGCIRGLLPFTPFTASTTYQFAHGGGTQVIFSDPPQLFNEFTAKGNNETITGSWTFDSIPLAATTTPTDDRHLITLFQHNLATSTGGIDGSETVRGVYELSTGAEAALGTSAGSTGARLAIPGSLATSTPQTTGNLAPITESDGKLNQSFLDLTEGYTWTGLHAFASTTMTTTTITDATITSSTVTTLNIGTTSTAALVNGGSADTLHDHSLYNLRVLANQAYRYVMGYGFSQVNNAGTGSFLQANNGFSVSSGASNGDRSSLVSSASFVLGITSNFRLYLPRLDANSSTNMDAFIGVINGCGNATDGVLTTDHAGVIFFDGVALASVADGATQTTSSLYATPTDEKNIRIERSGSNILFYVDSVLTATLSSNLPDTTSSAVLCATVGASGGGGARSVNFYGNYIYEEEK